ncbi:MAG: PEF-CTERM sorting domain-containing protein [Euryarchaeota archaeon]|nr:PEF-CTERM sorting domain-containing protein [Euryarchaeota archaeon]
MNRNIRLIILVGILITISTTTGTASELIINGGFETGDTTGWSLVGPVFDGSVTTVHHTGTYSLSMGGMDYINQTFSPAVSTSGNLTFWGKASDTFTGPAYATVTYSDATTSELMWGGGMISTTWTQFTVPVDNTKLVSKVLFNTGETIPLYLDDVSLSGVAAENDIPEFPTMAIPVISIIGLMFLFQRRIGK